MYLLSSSTERRTDKGALGMRFDAALANYLFCSLSVISKLKLHTFFFSFNLPNFRSDPFLNGGRSSSRAVLIGENGGALTLLVSKTIAQGWQSCICSGTE